MKQKIAIIGGGASGITLALLLQQVALVTVYERENAPLLKLLKTGNGKANIYNRGIQNSAYNHPSFMASHAPLMEEALDHLFRELGVLTYTDEEGRVYPFSRSAKGLREYLLSLLKVNLVVNADIKEVKRVGPKFQILDDIYDVVVLAMGSSISMFKYPLDNNNTKLLNSVDLTLSPLVPVIKTIKVREDLKPLANQRADVMLTLWGGDQKLFSERGEVLFKEDGLSGIVSFVVSSYFEWHVIEKVYRTFTVTIDFMPDHTFFEVQTIIKSKDDLPKVFAPHLVKFLANQKETKLVNLIKAFRVTPLSGHYPENAQAMCGGVDVALVTDDFHLKGDENLYLLGEVLDIDGICGGYNLGFAFYSATRAAKHLVDKLSK